MAESQSICFLLQDVPRLYGAERVTLDLIGALSRRLSVRLWLIGEQRLGEQPGALHAAAVESGLPVERFPVAGRLSIELVRQLRVRLRTLERPVLHTVGYKAHLHALAAARGLARTVTTMHGWLVRPELKERLYEWIEVCALRHDDAVICLSAFYEQQLLRAGVSPARLHRIPTGLDPARLPPRETAERWASGPFTVALIGRLSWEKNHDLLLRAVARLQSRGGALRVLLAGEGPERAAIERRIQALRLSERVQLIGYAAMSAVMPAVHAVVLCSRIENLPLSLLEAMAWARPVVATSVGGVPDVVEEGRTGYLIPDNDEEALAERIHRLAADPALARRLGSAGRERVEREFGMARCVDRHVALYQTLGVSA